ncbi:hypothetical protein DER44DRAFT_173068 [Fusarium oxysporum]|nr:hypothetical protein DER44DRAFT_173068 [Fusarium oxysporum]
MLLFLLLLILINSIQPVHQFLLFFPCLEEIRVVSFVPVVEGRYVCLYMPDIIFYLNNLVFVLFSFLLELTNFDFHDESFSFLPSRVACKVLIVDSVCLLLVL